MNCNINIRLFLLFGILMSFGSVEPSNGTYEHYFKYKDINGIESHTDQFHGCTVHISFWSKICAPCIRSFEENRELRKELMDDGVILLNATLDNVDEWQWALNKYNPNGLNIRPEQLQKVQRHFDVYFLPIYATLNIDGELVEYPEGQKGSITQFAKWYKELR